MKKFVYLIPVIIGILLAVHGVKTIAQAFNSRDWLSCEGTITHSEVIKKERRVKSGDRWKTRISYSPKIQYEYIVDASTHSSSGISLGARNSGREYVQQTVDYYPVGKIVEVYFNQENPSESTLEPGVTSGAYVPLAIGLIFIAIGFFVVKP